MTEESPEDLGNFKLSESDAQSLRSVARRPLLDGQEVTAREVLNGLALRFSARNPEDVTPGHWVTVIREGLVGTIRVLAMDSDNAIRVYLSSDGIETGEILAYRGPTARPNWANKETAARHIVWEGLYE